MSIGSQEKAPTGMLLGQLDGVSFSVEVPSLQYVRLTVKISHHTIPQVEVPEFFRSGPCLSLQLPVYGESHML